jgi:hypothetical protein
MSVTYFVALPFVASEEGPTPGEAMEARVRAQRFSKPRPCRASPRMLARSRSSEAESPTRGRSGNQPSCARLGWSRRIWMSCDGSHHQ